MASMSSFPHSPSGVLYAEDFDLPEERRPPPASKPPQPVILEPTFSLTDLKHATERAIAEGRAQERVAAEQEREARKTDAITLIGALLQDAATENARIAEAGAAALARTVLAAVAAVLPALAASHALGEVSALVRLLLPAMEREPALEIRVNPALLDPLRNELATVAVPGSIRFEWIGVEAMQEGDVAVKWQDGMMLRDTSALCADILALLTRPESGHPDRSASEKDALS